jgi:hypothetical protein
MIICKNYIMRYFLAIVILIMAYLNLYSQTIERLKVSTERVGDGLYDFYAENPNYFPMQMEIYFTEFENMSADCELPYVGTIMPGKHKIFTLSRVFLEIPGGFEYKFNTRIGAYPVEHDNDAVYLLPFSEGKTAKAVAFDLSSSRTPGKILWAFEMDAGELVHASRGGVVCQQTTVQERDGRKIGDNTITILHPDLTFGRYELLADGSFMVELGDNIEAGTPIARVGESRLSPKPQLRFWVYYVSSPINKINAGEVNDIHSYINPVFKGKGRKTIQLEDGEEYSY